MKNRKTDASGSIIAMSGKPLKKRIMDNWQLYAMLLIPVILTIIYKYIPMYGIQIAFRDYKASQGMFGSEWVGLKWFQRFFFSAHLCENAVKYPVAESVQPVMELSDSHFSGIDAESGKVSKV
ncbi:putative multiple-sugar transport system permease YteP [Lachnospiraceae bacterium]|nr:putative multiple-sugar transport system permease YteP [Lachnospiraceae bacterium]